MEFEKEEDRQSVSIEMTNTTDPAQKTSSRISSLRLNLGSSKSQPARTDDPQTIVKEALLKFYRTVGKPMTDIQIGNTAEEHCYKAYMLYVHHPISLEECCCVCGEPNSVCGV